MSVDRAWFLRCAAEYESGAGAAGFPIDRESMYPCDDRAGGPAFDAHYAHMDLWAARKVNVLDAHVDVGSRVDGFCTHLLARGAAVEHVDIRDPRLVAYGFTFRADDARTLATFPDASVYSLSCLHVAEHVGLGRYGDAIDPEGMVKCMRSLARILAPRGRLYFAVPVGRHRIVFNAHRIASPGWVAGMFAREGLALESFAAVDDAGRFVARAALDNLEAASYACGMYEFSRP